MAARIEIDGKFYRYRRGKLVEIPRRWVGHVTSPATIRQRPSKLSGPAKRRAKDELSGGVNGYKDRRDTPPMDYGMEER